MRKYIEDKVEELKPEATRLFIRYRDRAIQKWLKREKNAIRAGKLDGTPRAQRYYRLAQVYWEGRLKRPFALKVHPPKPAPPRPKAFNGPIELDTESPRYGMVKEGYWFLRLDGMEFESAVEARFDEENTTLFLTSYRRDNG